MFSPLDRQAVMRGLGDKFILSLAESVSASRNDLAEFREWRPGFEAITLGVGYRWIAELYDATTDDRADEGGASG